MQQLDFLCFSTISGTNWQCSPVLQTLVQDVAVIGCLQRVPPGQQHSSGADGANDQVQWLVQVHLPYGNRREQAKWDVPLVQSNKEDLKVFRVSAATCAVLLHIVDWDWLDGHQVLGLSVWREAQSLDLVQFNRGHLRNLRWSLITV